MKKTDIVTIVIPCYNSEKTLRKCMASVLKQTYKNIEVVLVDDGSADTTGHLCDAYKKKDARVRVIHQANKGLMDAWQQGVKIAQGDYIAFADSDDWIEADMVRRMLQKALQYDADVVIAGMEMDYEDGRRKRERIFLKPGYYDAAAVRSRIHPYLFGTSTLQSPAVNASRCTKLVRKELLVQNMELLPRGIDVGEDDLTSFAVIMDAQSVYMFGNYYPYHYCRNSASMLGRYPQDMFGKYRRVSFELQKLADRKGYGQKIQLSWHFLWLMAMGLKKTAQDQGLPIRARCRILKREYEADDVQRAVLDCRDVQKGFQIHEKIFMWLLKYRLYFVCVLVLHIGKCISPD